MDAQSRFARGIAACLLLAGMLAAPTLPARATGTALIQKSDGSTKIYKNVTVRIADAALAITSADGEGTIVIGKASCTKIGELLRCLPYDATLLQHGETAHIPIVSGTVWLNPTSANQPLSHSSTQLAPHGVMMSLHTKAGTYVSLTGIVDEVKK
jgi:hypothetical protein